MVRSPTRAMTLADCSGVSSPADPPASVVPAPWTGAFLQLAQLKQNGLTIVLAEQNVRFVSELGDRVYILEKGMVRYQGSMSEFLADEPVRQAYLAV